jgi:UDP-3-O-[3-hydroxymyristoyl] glucosamine N-acyltransferase
MRLSDIAGIVGLEVIRDGEFKALGLLSYKCDLLIVQLYDAKYAGAIKQNSSISCVITTKALVEKIPEHVAVAISNDPSVAFYALHGHLIRQANFYWGDHFDSDIAASAKIHEAAYVAKQNVRIGEGSIVEPNVTIHERCIIGKGTVIRSGSVIGGEGFEPKWVAGKHVIVQHGGGVRIGDGVEIQSNCHVARAVFGGFTEIGNETMVDSLVNISHNVVIGSGCEIAAGSSIAGSTSIGDNVWIGPGSTISSGIKIGDDASITLGSVVVSDVAKGQRVTGNFAVEHTKFLSFFMRLRKGWS